MKIEYSVTLDEIVETQLYWLRGSGVYEKWIIWGCSYWVLITLIIVYLGNGNIFIKFLVGAIFGALVGGPIIFRRKELIAKRLRKTLVKKLGEENNIHATVEIDGENIIYESEDTVFKYALKNLKSAEIVENGLLLDFDKGKLIFLPNKAFESKEQLECWVNEIESIRKFT